VYKHFIITRFNLKFGGHFNKDKSGLPTQTKTWLDERFHLFEKYCFPSIQNQTCLNFTWFVLFDIETPDEYKNKLVELEKVFSNFKPLFLKSGDFACVSRVLNEEVEKRIDSSTTHIITSRIDNDDTFNIRIIEEIQKRFFEQDDEFLNFEYGLQYDVSKKILVEFNYKKNHFLSRIEKLRYPIHTVLSEDHTQVDNIARVSNILIDEPMWIEVVHQSNVSNATKLLKPVFEEIIFSQFGIKASLNTKNTLKHFKRYIKKCAFVNVRDVIQYVGLFPFLKRAYKLLK
jgi:hypothetical protein